MANPHELYSLSREGIGFDGRPASFDGWAYPSFELMRTAVKADAELFANGAVIDDFRGVLRHQGVAVGAQFEPPEPRRCH